MVKNLPATQKTWVPSLSSEDLPEEGNDNPTLLVFLPEKSHGQRSLAGHSPLGLKESDTTEVID